MLTRPDANSREETLTALRQLIVDGGYSPGDRLPAERELIVKLGINRTALRRALEALEFEGAIWRHVGKGTFVAAEASQPAVGRLADLARQVSPVNMMRARLSIEPALAREAALNASESDLTRLRLLQERARNGSSWSEYEEHDDAFHRAVAEATGNVLLLALFDQLNQVRRAVAWNTVERASKKPPADHSSFAEHDRIIAAIKSRDSAQAHAEMRSHLGSVSARLFGEP